MRAWIVLSWLLMAILGPVASYAQTAGEQWQVLARAALPAGQASVRVDLQATRGGYKGVRLTMLGSTAEITLVEVAYSDGRVHNETRRINLRPGERTRIIDASAQHRFLTSVVLRYTLTPPGAPATVVVEGLQSPEGLAMTRGAPGGSGSGAAKKASKPAGFAAPKADEREAAESPRFETSRQPAARSAPPPAANGRGSAPEEAARREAERARALEVERQAVVRQQAELEAMRRRAAEERARPESAERQRRMGAARPAPPPAAAPAPADDQRRARSMAPQSAPAPSAAAPAPSPRTAVAPPPPPVVAAPAPSTPATPPPSAASRPALEASPAPSPDPAWTAEQYAVVPVFFGTDRKQGETKKSKLGEDVATFGVVSDRKLLYGRAEVTVPRSDKVRERGSITRPGWELFGFRVVLPGMSEDPATHFTVKSVKPLSKAEFLDDVARRFADGRTFKNQALLFVHGYNVSFEDALYRAAQITHDIGFDGAPLLYSWPSIARATGYLYDAEQVKGARRYLREFVETIARETQVSDLHIVAHSMGAEAMVEVLRELGTVATAKADLKINQIILAAPDIDRENFEQLAETIVGLARGGVTLYASNNDTALRASRQLRLGRYRAGDVPPEGPILIKGIDTIDITRASTDFFSLNHTLFIERLKLINDMRLIFERGLRPPDQRSTESVFKPVTTDRGIYWQYLN